MPRLRIGIDGFNLAMAQGGGIATYGHTLGHVLAAAGHSIEGVFGLAIGGDPLRREARFVESLRAQAPNGRARPGLRDRARLFVKAAWPFLSPHARVVPLTGQFEKEIADRLPPFARIASSADLFAVAHRHFIRYGRFLPLRMDDPPALMHWTYPLPVRLEGARNIYTLHDLVPLKMPWATRDNKRHYRRLVHHCAETAAHICTVSEASRRDIVSLLEVAEDRVTNTAQTTLIPAGAPDVAADAALLEQVFALRPHGYFLFVGTIEPKKNVGRLLEAYLGLDSETPLVLAGGRGFQADAELRLLPGNGRSSQGPRGRVLQLDYVSPEMLARLVRSARALVFPSLLEGFGLPVLEALQVGTPVLTSRTSSLPEITGTAALLVDPRDTGAIAEGLRALDGDADLRRRLAREGPIRAKRFAPAPYLARLENMYARVLADR